MPRCRRTRSRRSRTRTASCASGSRRSSARAWRTAMGSLEPTAEEVRALVAEARAEARIEAKEILRGRFVEEYLRAAADGAEQPPPRQVPEPARAHEPAPPPVAAPSGDAWYVYCVAEAGVAAALTGVAGREVQT